MENSMNAVMATNELYNNSLTQFMNIQIAINEKKLTKQQATAMIRNVANMMKVQYGTIEKAFNNKVAWQRYDEEYRPLFKELVDQMQEYLQTELNPTKSL